MSRSFGSRSLSVARRNSFVACALSTLLVAQFAHSADDKKAAKPATVEDAVKALDLAKFPLMKGASEPNRSVAQLSYNAPSDCKSAFEFQQKALIAQKWTEVPGSTVTDQYASGVFTRDGFVASLSTTPLPDPKQPGLVNITLMLHGNVDLKKLPVPADAKAIYVGPQVAMYATESPLAKTVEATRKQLLAQGWQLYGTAGDVQFFKQNAIRLTASIAAAPAQGGKTSISFSAEQLSADIPAPAETVQLQYSDSTKQILFDTKDTEDNIVAFYRKALDAAGWKATTDNTIKIDWKNVLIFRNAAKDMLTMEMYFVKDEKVLRVTVKHQSAAEVAAIEKRLDEQAAAAKMKKDQEKNAKLPTVKITLPKGATLTEVTKKQLEFTVGAGKAKAAATSIRKALKEAGWKEDVTAAEDMLGEIGFTKDKQEISLSYVDTGIMPAEFTIKGTRVELEKVEAKE